MKRRNERSGAEIVRRNATTLPFERFGFERTKFERFTFVCSQPIFFDVKSKTEVESTASSASSRSAISEKLSERSVEGANVSITRVTNHFVLFLADFVSDSLRTSFRRVLSVFLEFVRIVVDVSSFRFFSPQCFLFAQPRRAPYFAPPLRARSPRFALFLRNTQSLPRTRRENSYYFTLAASTPRAS